MLLAEDLLLLLTEDDTGKLAVGSIADLALGGAQLVELSMVRRVDIDDKKRLVVVDGSPTGDEILDHALEVVQRRAGKRPSAVVGELGKTVRERLYARLTAVGILRAEQGRVLGVFPTRRWPTASADHEAAVRRALTGCLVQGLTPQPRDAALVALLHAIGSTHRVVDPKEHGLKRKQLDRRAKEIADGGWASDAVRRAVEETMAAVMVAVSAATFAATGAG